MTGADVLLAALHELPRQIRIGEQAARHADEVEAAAPQALLTEVRVEPAGRPHRDGDAGPLARLGQRDGRAHALAAPVEPGRKVDRRLGIEQAVRLQQAAAVAVALSAAVDPVRHLADEDGHPGALVDGGRERVVELGDVDERVHGEPGPAAPLGLRDDVAEEARAVLEALRAVLVVTPVPHPGEERVALVARAVVHLDGVESRLVRALGRGRPEVDLVLDLLPGHGAARQEVRAGELLLRQRGRALHVAELRVARQQPGRVPRAGVLQLDRHRAAVPVDGLGEAREALDEAVVVEVQLHALVRAVPAVVHVLDAERVLDAARLDHEEPDTASGEALVVGDHALADRLVVLHEGRPVGGLDQPVARGDRPDPARLEEQPRSHGQSAPQPASATLGALGAHTANDKDAGSSAGDMAMMPSAMRRSNSAHTATGSPSTS